MQNIELIVFYTKESFTVDSEITKSKNYYYNDELLAGFNKNKYEALYNFGFSSNNKDMLPSLIFLYNISVIFINTLISDSDIEITRKARPIDNNTLIDIMGLIPYAIGIEYINSIWVESV